MASKDGPTVEEQNDEVRLPPPPSLHGLLGKMLLELARQPTDIWRLTAPAELMNGISLLEYSKHYGDHPSLLAAISDSDDPKERMLWVVRWYVSSMFGSYGSRSGGEAGGYERKPYNPILGEQFHAEWAAEDGTVYSRISAEQVSHHPPISAFHIHHDDGEEGRGVHVQGYTGQSTSFKGTGIRVQQEGRLFVYVEAHNEEYTITLPQLHVFGLASAPYVEVTGPSLILGTGGWAADLDFKASGVFYGQRDTFGGVIYDNDTGQVHYDIWGNWKADSYFAEHDPRAKMNEREDGRLLFSSSENPPKRPRIKPVSEQSEIESRRVWNACTQALVNGDYKKAREAKNAVEEWQRGLRRERTETGEEWRPALFNYISVFHFLPITEPSIEFKMVVEEQVHMGESVKVGSNGNVGQEEYEEDYYSSEEEEDAVPYKGRWISKSFWNSFLDNLTPDSPVV